MTVGAEIPKGYKQTEVGVIPEDWEVRPLGSIAKTATGNTPPTRDPANYGDEFMFVSPVDMGMTKHIVRTEKMLSKKGFSISRRFPAGSVLFVCIGSTIGKCGIASETLTANQQINALLPSTAISSNYLYYAVLAIAPRVKSLAGEQAVPIVNKTAFSGTQIPLPSTNAEQEAIAEALSDVDALIESLEQLPAKKRKIKQGAMQELLTGKKRLPGFSGEWEVKRLGELALLSKFGVNPGATPDAPFTHFSLPAFDSGQIPIVEQGNLIGSNKFFVPQNAVLLSKLNPRIPRIWAPAHIPSNAVCSTEFLVLMPLDGVDRNFLAAVCCSPAVSYQMELHAIGTTGSHQRINPSQALAIEVNTPTDKPEQTAIATVLSDMDAEIAALEEKLTKARHIKQGMMQELLTGRIRLL